MSVDNCLVIAGRVASAGKTRHSPGGLPITRFVLEHHSKQTEAGIVRDVRCRILVFVGGEVLHRKIQSLTPGMPIRVHGFISRANHRQGAARLVLHAEGIETLDSRELNSATTD